MIKNVFNILLQSMHANFFCYIFEELNIDLYISQNIGLEIENKT